jgi:hypothetical protein
MTNAFMKIKLFPIIFRVKQLLLPGVITTFFESSYNKGMVGAL